MRFDYSLSANVLHSNSPPTLAAVKHNSSVISSYFNVAPGMTCTCVTVSPGLFVFVDDAEHPKRLRRMQLNMLEAMNIYVNVVEQGSFIRAAEVLELHRPAYSSPIL